MKTFAAIAAALVVGFAAPAFAAGQDPTSSTKVFATVSIAEQQMEVLVVGPNGDELTYTWTVSTGRSGYATPTGSYQPTWLSRHHRSRTYDNAPMPWAVFFHGGYAVHATDHVNDLGRPASHGCVRLSPEHAAIFFDLVRSTGSENTQIVITN